MALHHGHELSGHHGIDKTSAKISAHFTWPKLQQDITTYIGACLPCQLRKYPENKNIAEYNLKPIPAPMEAVSSDLFGPLPADAHGNTHIVTFVCDATGYLETIPVIDTSAQELIRATGIFIAKHGVPKRLRHDRGSNYTSAAFTNYTKSLGIHVQPVLSLAPWSNGRAEVINKHIAQYLTQFVTDNTKRTWSDHLANMTFAHNTSVHGSTGFTPFFLIHGRNARLPHNNFLSTDLHQAPLNEHVTNKLKSLDTALSKAKNKTHQQQLQQQRRSNKNNHLPTFAPTQLVTLWYGKDNAPRPAGVPKKLINTRTGPHEVISRLSNFKYRIKALDSDTTQDVHVRRLSLYTPLPPDPAPEDAKQITLYFPEEIMDSRFNNSTEYLIRWKDYPDRKDWTWEKSSSDAIKKNRHLVDAFNTKITSNVSNVHDLLQTALNHNHRNKKKTKET
jgi:hypothetical protein